MPTIPSRHSSLVGSTSSTPGKATRTLSVCDIHDLINWSQLRNDPMFVDIQEGHHVDFIFPVLSDLCTASMSPRGPSMGSEGHSHRSLRQRNSTTPLLVRSSSIKSGLEEILGKEKIPLFVPSQIIKPLAGTLMIPERHSSRHSPDAALTIGDATQDDQSDAQATHSREALSEASDWSTTVQFEAPKQEVFQSKPETSVAPDMSLTVRQESRLKSGKSGEIQRDARERVTPSASDGIKSHAGDLTTATHRYRRGSRMVQSCRAYYQRVKQHLWRSSAANVKNV